MRIRIKKKKLLGENRIDSLTKIDEVLVKEDLLDPQKANIEVYFKGKDSSGIFTLSYDEAISLMGSLNTLKGLPRNSRRINEK